jgi:hypothetical protein
MAANEPVLSRNSRTDAMRAIVAAATIRLKLYEGKN